MFPIEADSPFSIEQVTLDGEVVVLAVVGTAPEGRCPGCGAACRSVHDRYTRRPLELPGRGRVVRLALRVRRFRCRALGCRRATFAEDVGRRLPRRARRTAEAAAALLHLARTAGGEAGAGLAAGGGLPASPATLLRLERQAVVKAVPTPRVLGVDDLALRRGQRYHAPNDLANTLVQGSAQKGQAARERRRGPGSGRSRRAPRSCGSAPGWPPSRRHRADG